jgi:hypothetical protein
MKGGDIMDFDLIKKMEEVVNADVGAITSRDMSEEELREISRSAMDAADKILESERMRNERAKIDLEARRLELEAKKLELDAAKAEKEILSGYIKAGLTILLTGAGWCVGILLHISDRNAELRNGDRLTTDRGRDHEKRIHGSFWNKLNI